MTAKKSIKIKNLLMEEKKDQRYICVAKTFNPFNMRGAVINNYQNGQRNLIGHRMKTLSALNIN